MIRLEKANSKNVWKLIKLKVGKDQESFVASNDLSMIEAYLSLSENGHVFPFGIFDDEIPVGFLMIGYDVDASYENPPQIAYGNYNLWRLMIDAKYQNQGFGKEAIRLALDFIRSFPCGEAEYCYLSYDPDNRKAKKLYAEFGFAENGEKDGDEIIAVLKL